MRRLSFNSEIPPPLELECLKALWATGSGTVKDVRDEVAKDRPLAYTTIMTILERLVKRGSAVRYKTGRSFVYSPAVERETLRKAALQDLIDCFFDGSQPALISYLQQVTVTAGEPKRATAAAAGEERIDTILL
jgi:predicted transcriptional regulator